MKSILSRSSLATNSEENSVIPKTLKIDPLKIQELLIIQYTDRLLTQFEQELNTMYDSLKKQEIIMTPHIKEHHKIMDMLQNINKDLEKISIQRKIKLSVQSETILKKIRQDLKISDYNDKKK